MTKHQVFFSFEYNKDYWRASQVRSMGKVSGDSTFSDNDWEEVRQKTKKSIEGWIDKQLAMRKCLLVLVGSTTSTREWVRYEIEKAYELKKGIVGIYIHGLKDKEGRQTSKGLNPFDYVLTNNREKLSKYVKCIDPLYKTSIYVYHAIETHIGDWIQNAVDDAGKY